MQNGIYCNYSLHPLLIAIFQNYKCSKMVTVAINSSRNNEFLVKILEDQQKVYVALMRLISTLGALGHCAMEIYLLYLDGGSSK